MHAVCLIAQSLPEEEKPEITEESSLGICAVTGLESQTLSRKRLFGSSFTDGALLAAPTSDRVSVEAYIALKYKWERMSSWICDGQHFRRLNRVEVRDAVLGHPPKMPWAAYATTSYKKHGALRTPVNGLSQNRWIFENKEVDCSDLDKMMDWWARLNHALRLGLGRTILETLDCPAFMIRKVGLSEWMAFEKWAAPCKNTALYAFLCYLLPSQEELKNERQVIQDNGKTAL